MQQIVVLFCSTLILIPISSSFEIIHGDKYNTKSDVSFDDEGDLNILINQETDGGLYFIKNEETGVEVEFLEPEIPNEKEGVVYHSLNLKDNGKNYKFEYSTSNQQARVEEGNHAKGVDGSELEVKGSFTYVNPSGGYFIQGYTADINGYRAKVSFGPKVAISLAGVKSVAQELPSTKGIDGALLCSLIGGGCKK